MITQYSRHNCPIMAAGMSFFGMMSLIPLALIGVSTLGYILGSSESAQQFVFKILSKNFPRSAENILDQIYIIITSPERTFVNWLGLLGLVWSGMRFFNILQRVLNSIWVGATQRRFLRSRAIALLIFVSAGLFFWASFAFSWLMRMIEDLNIGSMAPDKLWLTVELVVSFAASTIMIFLVYLLVPHARVFPKAALIGSIFSATLLELSKWGFNFVMIRFDVYGKVYGPLAGIIIFISWLYLSMSILLMGAELGSQYQAYLAHCPDVQKV